jgi:hypothetical protein
MIIINSSEPLDIDGLSLRVFLEFVPHGESAFSGHVAFDIHIILCFRFFVNQAVLRDIFANFTRHFLVPFVHRDKQFFHHLAHIFERNISGVLHEIKNFLALVKLFVFAADFDTRELGFEFEKLRCVENIGRRILLARETTLRVIFENFRSGTDGRFFG